MPKIATHKVFWEMRFDSLRECRVLERNDAIYSQPGCRKCSDAWKTWWVVRPRTRSFPPQPPRFTVDEIAGWFETEGIKIRSTVDGIGCVQRHHASPGLTDDQMIAFKLRFQ